MNAAPMTTNVTQKHSSSINLPRGMSLRKVMCWVNSTLEADWIVQIAKSLVSAYNGDCQVVMCMDRPTSTLRTAGSHPSGQTPLTPELLALAGQKLSEMYGEDVRTMVLPGHPITEIRRYARTQQVDLIVMGEQALALEKVYGERLFDDAPCTVMLLVTPGSQKNPSNGHRDQDPAGPQHER